MTPQEVIRQFMATLVEHDYDDSADFKSYVLDDAITSASKFSSTQEVIDAMKADQVAAEKLAVEEVLGSSYAGKTIAQVSSSVLKADAKNYDVNNTGNAYYNSTNDSRSTVEALIKERKAYIFLEKYCGIQLESKYWITSGGSVTRWTGGETTNVDTGAITGSDANITLQSGDVVEGRTLTAADLTELAKNYGDKATLSDDGNTIVIGTGTEKTEASVVPEEFVNTYTTSTTAAQVINTGTRDWVVKATSKADTITSGGADSINSDAGNDIITVNGNGATIATGTGYDSVNISAEVKNVTLSDLNANDAITISGTFEVGEATIEDMVLVITDATGTRKVKFSDFTTATGATINIEGTSTTIGDWLTENGIDLDNLEQTTYAESVGVGTSSGNIAPDGEDRTVVDDEDDRTVIDPDYTPPTTKTVEKSATPDVTPNTASADFATATGVVTVNLDELDTSAAGSAVVDGAKVGTLSSTYPDAAAFTRNGLTIHLLGELTKSTVNQNIANGSSSDRPEDSDGDSQINPLTLDDLTDSQRTIIAGLFKWWAKYALTLNEEAYGIGFESDTAKVKDIGLYFYNDSGHDGNLAAVWSWGTTTEPGHATQLMLSVNTYYYDNLSDTDVDGTTTVKGAGLLDRTLSHEFVHASMASNITYFSLLPKFIKEGTAELTHGIDDERGNSIFRIAYDADRLEASLDVDGTDTSGLGNAYAGGYMFLRYFARNAALQTLFDVNTEPDPLLITLTEGDDNYTNITSDVRIMALGGNDTIVNTISNVTIDGGADDDSIANWSGENVSVNGGAGNDSIDNLGIAVMTINGGAGDDYIYNRYGASVTIDGGQGNDRINNEGSNSTIDGGAGDDIISLISTSNLVRYAAGSGNDTIIGFNESDTLTITGGSYSTQESGDDVVITVGNGSILLVGAKGKALNINNSQPATNTITLTEGNDTLYTNLEGVMINALGGDDYIWNIVNNVSVEGGAGDDIISNSGSNSNLTGGEDNDTISNSGANVIIDGGQGNDYISNSGENVSIDAGAGDNYIINAQGNNVTIQALAGNDTIDNGLYGLGGSNIMVNGGEGNDSISSSGDYATINGGAGDDTIANGPYGPGGSNVMLDGGSGADIISNGKKSYSSPGGDRPGQEELPYHLDSTASAGELPVAEHSSTTEVVGAADNATLLGGADNDTIYNEGNNSYIDGGEDNDQISNSGSNVTIEGGAGDDSIRNEEASNVLIDGGQGNDSIENGGWKTYSNGSRYTLRGGDNVTMSGGADDDSIRNYSGSNVSIDGGQGDDFIEHSGDNSTISGGEGNDSIYNGYYDAEIDNLFKAGSDVTISGGAGNDYIENNQGSRALIDGGEGNDAIWNYGSNSTIDGDAGDDSIYNNWDEKENSPYDDDDGSNVVFKYTPGEGNDTIYGFNETSTLSIADGAYTSQESGDDVIVTVGDGSVILVGAAALGTLNIEGEEARVVWTLDGTTATYGTTDETLITITGLKRGLTVNDDGTITGIDLDGDVITLSANVLGTSTVKVSGDCYLALGDDVEESTSESRWKISGTTATLRNSTTEGYTLSDDERSITYSAAKTGEAIVTISGLKSGLTVNGDGTITGIDFNDDVITLSANVLGTTTVKVTGDYTLALGVDVPEPEEGDAEWKISGTTATFRNSTTAGYTLSDDGRSITYTPAQSGEAIVTISGLKSGLTVNGDGTITGIDFNDDNTIYLSANVLGTTTVKVTGDYTLALGEDVPEPVEGDAAWQVSGTTAILRQSTTAGYTLSDDAQSITYTPAQTGAALVTITGLKSGLTVDDDGYIDGVDFDGENTIYLSANVLGTTTVKVSGDYYLALGEDVYPPEPGEPEWTVSGTTATLRQGMTEGYTLSDDGQSITYTPAQSGAAIATITGLARNLTVDDLNDGIYIEDDTIYLSANVLGTSTVKVSGDYYLALGEDVYPPEPGEPEWTVRGTTATLRQGTTEGYTLSEDGRSITYTPAQSGEAIVTITGLKSGLRAEDGYIEGVDFDGENTIYLSANVLGTTTVKVSGDYYLAFGNEVKESTVETEWKLSGTKATLSNTTTTGYTLSDDAQTITYSAKEMSKPIAVVSGLKKGLTEEELNDGTYYDTDSEQITLYADVLGTTKVTVKDSTKNTDYTLTLGDDVIIEPEETDTWSVSGTTATFKRVESAYFYESTNGKTINYKAETKGKTLATVSGLKSKLPVNGDGTITGIDIDDDNVITLSDNVLNQKKVTLKGNDYTLALGVDVELSEQAKAPEWKVSGTKATLSTTTTTGYALSDDEKSITYNAKEKTAAVVTLTGIKKDLEPEEVDAAIEYDLDEKVITLSADVLGTSKITVKEKGYTLALGDDVDEPEPVENTWIISGTKATLSDGTSAGYTLSKDARSITYTAAKATGKAKATITGLKKGTTAEDLDFDGETITLSAEALGASKVTLKGTGYTLALGGVDPVEYEDYNWTLNAKKQTATLKANATAGYSCDGSTITYSKAKSNVTIATVTGVTDTSGLEFDGETLTLSGDSLTDKVTVSGNVAFEFGDDFNDATITGSKAADIITVNGTGVTINAGKGDDQLTTAGGNTFLYASGDDVIADFTEDDRIKITSGTVAVDTDEADVVVTITKGKTVGTITLTEAAGQTISILDSKNKTTTYETTAADNNPYWFIDDDFETTPQLADITATTDCMLGEMDFNDATQLVQTTPIVTASDKK